jgi:Tfp pilus assembly protein PilF
MGRSAEAETLFRGALEGQRRVFGAQSPQTLKAMCELAMALIDVQKFDEADALLARAVETGRTVLGERHPDYLYLKNTRGWLLYNQERYPEAAQEFQTVVTTARLVMPPDHAWTLFWQDNLGWALVRCDKFADAEPVLSGVLEADRRILGDDHRETLRARLGLAVAAAGQGRADEAERLALQVYAVSSTRGPEWLNSLCLTELARLYDSWGKPEQGASYRALLPKAPPR